MGRYFQVIELWSENLVSRDSLWEHREKVNFNNSIKIICKVHILKEMYEKSIYILLIIPFPVLSK